MDDWRRILEFPNYLVSSRGEVVNEDTGRYMTLLLNQRGIVHVGLTKGKIQHKRSVSVLVATAFLPPPPTEAFDTPINLDGERIHNNVENLAWRPRWFARKYFIQFRQTEVPSIVTPIEERKTHECFDTSWDAATTFGLLDREIYIATIQQTYVWPTYQQFRVI